MKHYFYLMCRYGGWMIILLAWGCRPSSSDQPKAPRENYLYSDMQIQDEKQLSIVNLPLQMPVAELQKQLNAQLTGLIYEDNSYDDNDADNLKAKVWKLSPINVQALDSTFLIDVPLKVWVSVGYRVNPLGLMLSGYKDTEFALRIRLVSTVGVTPDWQLDAHTRVDSYDWLREPSIKVAGLNIPVKSMVSRTMSRNFEKITAAIDKQVRQSLDLRKYVLQAWELARRPVLLSPEYHTWLVLVPTAAVMTPLMARDGVLRTTVGVRGFTQTVTSAAKPEIRGATRLPPLQTVKKIPEDFKVKLIGVITYDEAARFAKAQLAGRRFSFNDNRHVVEVTDIALFGQDEKLVIKANLTGSITGSIYLKGIPHYDPEAKTLVLKQVDYDLDTRNVLQKTAGWLMKGKFSKLIEQNFVLPVGDQITEARATLQKSLVNNRLAKNIVLDGTITDVVPDRVYLTPQHIYAVVLANGKASMRIEGPF